MATRAQQIAQYEAELNKQFPPSPGESPSGILQTSGGGISVAEAYGTYMNAHPSANPATVYAETVAEAQSLGSLSSGLGAAIQNFLNAGATGVSQEAEGGALGAAEAANAIPGLSQIGDFFGALTSANTWIRLAKVVFGGALLIIGIAHITGASGAIADAARKAPLPV